MPIYHATVHCCHPGGSAIVLPVSGPGLLMRDVKAVVKALPRLLYIHQLQGHALLDHRIHQNLTFGHCRGPMRPHRVANKY